MVALHSSRSAYNVPGVISFLKKYQSLQNEDSLLGAKVRLSFRLLSEKHSGDRYLSAVEDVHNRDPKALELLFVDKCFKE